MLEMYKILFFCSLLLSLPFLEARRSGGGGGGMRGSSGARTNSGGGGGFSPNRGGSPNQGGGGFQQPNYGNRPSGGFQQQPNYGNQGGFHGPTNTGFQRPSNFNNQGWNRSPGFSGGNGLGSASRGSTFKYALAGAALGTVGGLLAFEAGKAIINSATTPFHHQGRDYYFNQENYRGQSNVPRCSVPLSQIVNTNAPPATPVVSDGNSSTPAPEQTLQNIQFRDGSKPREVVWSCNMGEICCGTDCCPAPAAQNSPNSASGHGGSHGSGISGGWIALIGGLALFLFY